MGRFLNYLLVPILTAKLSAESGGYGIVTNLYAWTALLLVILTYGMETTFFRFSNKEEEDPKRVYSTTLITVGFTSALFVALLFIFIGPISNALGYADHPSYVWTLFTAVALDAFQCVMFAYLRYRNKPWKFAFLKLLFIILSIVLTLLYYVFLPKWGLNPFGIYDEKFTLDPGYVFYINLLCTSFVTLFFWRELTCVRYVLDLKLLRRMLRYSWPLLILGIAGILNQAADKILFPYLYDGSAEEAKAQLGIYGAASKIAMIMAMITQAFRYAYEPFVFGKSREKGNKEMYARAMKYFLIFTLLAFLMVMGYMQLLRHIIGKDYWSGLDVVPIVMTAEIMMGIYFNLSFWYKLIDKTHWGAILSGIGCTVLIAVNVIFVPRYGYMACAWGGFAGYGTAMALSYIFGQKYYPIAYPLRSIFVYVVLAASLFAGIQYCNSHFGTVGATLANTALIGVFVLYTVKSDFPIANLPVVGKYFRKNK